MPLPFFAGGSVSSGNKSPSYLEEREKARRFLTTTKDGKFATERLRATVKNGDAAKIFDDDTYTDFAEIVREHKGGTVIAANNREAKEAFRLASGSNSTMSAPVGGPSRMMKVASVPLWYHMRKQIETCDPDYWNDPLNFLREMLANPQWCTVPEDRIRAEMQKYLPRGNVNLA